MSLVTGRWGWFESESHPGCLRRTRFCNTEETGRTSRTETTKRENEMSNALSNITVNGNMNIDDVLTVVTSRAEMKYNANLADAKKRLDEVGKEIKDNEKILNNKKESESLALAKEHIDAISPTIKALGGSVKASSALPNGDSLQCQVCISQGNGYYNVPFMVQGPKSKELVELEQKLAGLLEQQAVIQKEALQWKKKLASIPTLERQYKARIAEAKLAASEDGQALLDMLTGDLEQNILNLPAN